MTTFDFSPLFRTAIGFDRMADAFESAHRADAGGYPPYNIELTGEDQYQITLAVAGFSEQELQLEVKENILTVTGAKNAEHKKTQYLHQGIANRGFERKFQLADYVRVEDAELANGLLNVRLVREIPEAMKPRTIAIRNAGNVLLEAAKDKENTTAAA